MQFNLYTSSTIEKKRDSLPYQSIFNIEYGLLTCVAIIGIIGSLFVFNNNSDVGAISQDVSYSFIPTEPFIPKNNNLVFISEDDLTVAVRRLPEAGDNKLFLDMGDGSEIMLEGRKIEYTYKKSGYYDILLTLGGSNRIINRYSVSMENE